MTASLRDNHDEYASLLCSYAAGTLDEAHAMLAAAYISFCPQSRNYVGQCEAMGGALIETCCDPVSLDKTCLQAVLARLDHNEEQKRCKTAHGDLAAFLGTDIPAPLCSYLRDGDGKPLSWKPFLPGIKIMPLSFGPDCKASAVLMKVGPGVKTPSHTHRGTEMTLVLDGAFDDETGHYGRGDLLTCDGSVDHQPIADKKMGCLCVVVNTEPVKFTGPISRFLNIFVRA